MGSRDKTVLASADPKVTHYPNGDIELTAMDIEGRHYGVRLSFKEWEILIQKLKTLNKDCITKLYIG